jgi:ankyrin repeat protein
MYGINTDIMNMNYIYKNISDAVLDENKAAVLNLIDRGENINQKDSKGITPLMHSAGEGYFSITKLLIERGADVNLSSNFGYTALHEACENAHVEIVCLLVEKDADVNIKTSSGKNAFDLCIDTLSKVKNLEKKERLISILNIVSAKIKSEN